MKIDVASALANGASIDDIAGQLPEVPDNRIRQHLEELFDRVASVRDGSSGELSIPTPWPGVNKLAGGWPISGVTILAARPGTGKTSILEDEAPRLASKAKPVGSIIVSLEMPAWLLTLRMVLREALTIARRDKVHGAEMLARPVGEILKRRPLHLSGESDAVLELMAPGFVALKRKPIVIVEPKARTLDAIFEAVDAELEAWPFDVPCGMVWVDYLGLVDVAEELKNTRSMQNATQLISARAATRAKQSRLAWVWLHQLNRGNVRDLPRPPRASDLRDSGAIEQDATLILLPWRPMVDNPNSTTPEHQPYATDAGRVEPSKLIVAKARLGEMGIVSTLWRHADRRFVEPDFSTYAATVRR